MYFVSHYSHPQGWVFHIRYEEYVGGGGVWMLYIWDADGNNTHDYDQDTLEIARQQAYEDFGVPLDSWEEVPAENQK